MLISDLAGARSASNCSGVRIESFLVVHFLGTVGNGFLKLRRAEAAGRSGAKSVAHGESGHAGIQIELKMHMPGAP